MSYDTGTPQATDRVSDTQQPILTNFQQLNAIYGEDHYDYTVQTSNEGFHRAVHLPSAAGIPSTAANVGALYSKTTSSVTWPYWRRDGGSVDYPAIPIKAYCTFVPQSVNGACTLINNFGITSVTRTATAKYTLLMPALPSANYLTMFTSVNTGNLGVGGNNTFVAGVGLFTTTGFDIWTYNFNTGVLADSPLNYVNIIIIQN